MRRIWQLVKNFVVEHPLGFLGVLVMTAQGVTGFILVMIEGLTWSATIYFALSAFCLGLLVASLDELRKAVKRGN